MYFVTRWHTKQVGWNQVVLGCLVSLLVWRGGKFFFDAYLQVFPVSDKNRAPDNHAVGNFDARFPVRFKSLNLKGPIWIQEVGIKVSSKLNPLTIKQSVIGCPKLSARTMFGIGLLSPTIKLSGIWGPVFSKLASPDHHVVGNLMLIFQSPGISSQNFEPAS